MDFNFGCGLYRVIKGPEGIFRLFVKDDVPEGYTVIQEPPIDMQYWSLERWHMHLYYTMRREEMPRGKGHFESIELDKNLFPELENLPTTNNSIFENEHDGKVYYTHSFVNGYHHEQGESVIGHGVDTIDEAIDLTRGCIQTILKEYPVVAVRVKPELRKFYNYVLRKTQFFTYMRLAF